MNRIGLGVAVALAAAMTGPSAIAQRGDAPSPAGLAIGQTVAGELTSNDSQRRSGKFEDVYVIQGRRGQRIDLRLASDAFDPYLVVSGPEGFSLGNDDEEGGRGALHSRLVLELPLDGTYRVTATSFRAGELGTYRLSAAPAPAGIAATRPEPAQPIRVGATVNGSLAAGDGRRGEGAWFDNYRFTARRGERVRIALGADKFDTVLTLRRPDGTEDVSDDTEEDGETSTNSRIDTVLAEDGDYVISVSSFRPGETGPYRLSLAQSPGLPRQLGVQGGPRVIALLVGVSDYERTSDLANTDDDATELYETLRRAGLLHPASVVLTNSEATTKTVSDAFRRVAAAAGPNDLFLFLFSGHGNQVDVPVSAAELDGRAETIELYDAAMTDAELAPLFAGVRARMSMLVIDACYAGGFRSLVDRPNVIGMFSSEEDLTSLVASRFQAGGFLSYFLRAGITGEADDDGDRIVTAGELSTYVRRRFRREGDVPATTREDERNYQTILVERGGVHIDDVIVRLGTPARLAAAPAAQQASLTTESGKPPLDEEEKRR
ncbi:caspase family protein [Sphingosinicella sp. LHD-64]|uniref:caspase family protein n=1 Tax=Sphingosinicella sp. LHD-64 TaxID=3072139 RepID=UPI00280E7A2A|nr:caspase family protein [Sphingosinicella sp. LHD-64]MDQ8754951.1 caspase family protein [Sphingosinicella sp. LHD-64]